MRDLLPTHSRRRAIRGTLTLIRSNIVAKSEWGGERVEGGYDSVLRMNFLDKFTVTNIWITLNISSSIESFRGNLEVFTISEKKIHESNLFKEANHMSRWFNRSQLFVKFTGRLSLLALIMCASSKDPPPPSYNLLLKH